MGGGRAINQRDEAIRAAMRDAGVLAGILEGEFQATYRGSEQSEHVRVLTEIVTSLGGSVDAGAFDLAATFEGRRIAIRFGSRESAGGAHVVKCEIARAA
jgi:hypothetical protein